MAVLTVLASVIACSPSSLIDVQSPSTVVDPSLVSTATAAAQLRNGALLRMIGAASNVVETAGLITDELSDTYNLSYQSGNDRHVRNDALGKNAGSDAYDNLQNARIKALQARQALQLYANGVASVPSAWQGEMYALEGYTVVWLAELYCSGIPLTSVPLQGPQVPTRGLTTEELLTQAITLFDSAMVAGADSARFVDLARVGKARALLDLGQFATADSVVQSVPTDFVYVIPSVSSSQDGAAYFYIPINIAYGIFRTQDREGSNGLIWSTDPRTGVTTVSDLTGDMLWPAKYNVTASGIPNPTTPRSGVPFRLADGLEARLIQAEAALARGDASWLTILNTLRSTCVGTASCAVVPGLTTASLSPIIDPGTSDTRLDTLMKERAMWLYFTGHREGDMRRLARVYDRDRESVWPTGLISTPAFPPLYSLPDSEDHTPYGPDVVYEPDTREKLNNSLYGGCYDTNP